LQQEIRMRNNDPVRQTQMTISIGQVVFALCAPGANKPEAPLTGGRRCSRVIHRLLISDKNLFRLVFDPIPS